jgi:hypothetical protein
MYTVRSGYHLAKDTKDRDRGGGGVVIGETVEEGGGGGRGVVSTSNSLEKLWKRIWKLRGPRVVKMFLWQACNNILPTKANLFNKKITSDPLRLICGLEVETVGHALWSSLLGMAKLRLDLNVEHLWKECSPLHPTNFTG